MKTRTIHIVFPVAMMLTTVGCSTTVSVKDFEGKPAEATPVNGIPFRMKEHYRVSLYRLNGGKYEKLETRENHAVLPNLERVYVLQMSSAMLADGKLTFKMNPDNTLQFVKVDSTNKSAELITALGSAQKAIADAEAAKDKAEAAKKTAADADVAAREDARVAALDAEQAANLAVVELEALLPTATPVDRAKAEQKVAKAKLVANQKARRAGLALPFPEVGT